MTMMTMVAGRTGPNLPGFNSDRLPSKLVSTSAESPTPRSNNHGALQFRFRMVARMKAIKLGFQWWHNMKLRLKLTIGFLFLSGLIGVSGGSGLYSVKNIDQSVGVLSTVASPLLEEAMGLVDSMQKMHIALLDALAQQDVAHLQPDVGVLGVRLEGGLVVLQSLVERALLEMLLRTREDLALVDSQGPLRRTGGIRGRIPLPA